MCITFAGVNPAHGKWLAAASEAFHPMRVEDFIDAILRDWCEGADAALAEGEMVYCPCCGDEISMAGAIDLSKAMPDEE